MPDDVRRRLHESGTVLALVAALAALVLAAGGCLSPVPSEARAKLVVQVAVLSYVGDDADKARRLARIVDGVQAYVEGAERVDLARLERRVRERIPPDLEPAERLLVEHLLVSIRTEIEARVADEVVAPDLPVAVGRALIWIEDALAMVPEEE